MGRFLLVLGLSALIVGASPSAFADSQRKLAKRSQNAANIIERSVAIPDNAIPKSLLDQAQCVVTFPSVIRAGFVFGAKAGKGVASCRTNNGWSDPSYMTIIGGSWGLQIGVQSTDLVLVFVRPNAAQRLSQFNITLGADASLTAGPLGRNAQIGTDYQLRSEIYAYSRSRGLFAGLTISGADIHVDRSANATLYGDRSRASDVLLRGHNIAPSYAMPYVQALERYAP